MRRNKDRQSHSERNHRCFHSYTTFFGAILLKSAADEQEGQSALMFGRRYAPIRAAQLFPLFLVAGHSEGM